MSRIWKMRPFDPDLADRLVADLSISPLVARLLVQRGISDPVQARTFLEPSQDVLHSPFLFSEIEQAIERIALARERGERVVIHGDYDVDGISGTAVLLETLWELGVETEYFLPHRIEDGYGVATERIRELAGQFNLMITVDCGTTAVEPIRLARERGMDVIVTDHHQPGGERPAASAVLNPVREEEEYPFPDLSGSGVAYKLSCALRESLLGMETPEKEGLDLAALGTVSDVVPLVEENRTIVSWALDLLRAEQRPGIKALLDVSYSSPKDIDSTTMGFRIGPRINALGRMGDPRAAVELLVTRDEVRAYEIASEMHRLNGKRQALEKQVLREATQVVAREGLLEGEPPLIVVGGDGWHRGVIGIVAARLVEQYGRPVVLLSREDGVYHGSGRSVPGKNLASILESVRPLLLSGGGHEGAIGMKMDEARFAELRDNMTQHAKRVWGEHIDLPPLWVDAEIPLEQVDHPLIEELKVLAPHGESNPAPVFLFRGDASARGGQIVGNNHLRLTFAHSRGYIESIGFGLGDRLSSLKLDSLEIAASPTIRTFQGRSQIQLRIVDIRNSEHRSAPEVTTTNRVSRTVETQTAGTVAQPALNRQRLGVVFRLLRSTATDDVASRKQLYQKCAEENISKEEAYLALIIFAEIGLVRIRGDRIELLSVDGKRDLAESMTYRRLSEIET